MQTAQKQMVNPGMNITREDIELLVREPSPAMRQRICLKISNGYNSGTYTDSETKLANEMQAQIGFQTGDNQRS